MGGITLEEMSDEYFDVLKELGNIGAGNATTALSQMMQCKVDMSVPQVKLMEFKELGQLMGGEEIIMAGGIARKNPFIMQTYANVTGRTIQIAGSEQNAALSSAIWAALAAGSEKGGYDDTVLAAEKMGKLMDTVYVPNPEAKRRYDILYKEYIMLHDYFGRGGNNVMKRLKKTMSKI